MSRKTHEAFKATKTIKERESHELFINLSHGNKKLVSNEDIAFLIWNLPAVITCPYRTAHCETACYALKAERNYPDALPSRMRHFEISRNPEFVDRMIFTILTELSRPSNKNRKIVFRIHESGDFYNMAYAKAWLEIMDYFKNNSKIVFVAYTKSVCFFDGLELPRNFKLLASVWDDTKPANLEIIARNHFKIYTAYKGDDLKRALASGFVKCRCEDCATCGKCWNRSKKSIVCEIH